MSETHEDPPDWSVLGMEMLETLFGEGIIERHSQSQLSRLAPDFLPLLYQFCFGMFWSRSGIDIKTRSLITVAQVAALGRDAELKLHIATAARLGVTREELVEVLMHTSIYAGVPAAVAGLQAAVEVFKDELEAEAQ